MSERLVFLNAFPLNALPIQEGEEIVVTIAKEDYVSIKGLVKAYVEAGIPVECYIRHPSTVQVINKLFNLNLKPSNKLYRFRGSDKVIVVTLKKPIRGEEVEVNPEDIEFYIIGLEEDTW